MTNGWHESWQGSRHLPLWLDTADRPAPRPALHGEVEVDLLVVGGGFTGLWSALRAVERSAGLKVALVESDRLAGEASGRNGGFCEASLTHGEANGLERWPEEFEQLEALGQQNLAQIEAAIENYGIDCGFVRGPALTVATRPHEVAALEPETPGFLDAEAVRALVDSPTYLAGRLSHGTTALLDPARLAWGLASAAESRGVEISEGSRLRSLARSATHVLATTEHAVIRAKRVVLATNAFPNPLRRLRWKTVPVYDYVLATEPLTRAQLDSLGWDPCIGIADSGNQFHYYRITPDQRILWGGYDAVYHFGRSIDPQHDDRPATYETLAENFAATFPQLKGIRFTHRWSGVIDTSSRFCAFFGTAHGGRTAYAAGFTGLGVGASRFAADVMLDLLDGAETERTRLSMVKRQGIPFPPEPLAWLGIRATQLALAHEDRTGRRNAWLRLLDRLGMGFHS